MVDESVRIRSAHWVLDQSALRRRFFSSLPQQLSALDFLLIVYLAHAEDCSLTLPDMPNSRTEWTHLNELVAELKRDGFIEERVKGEARQALELALTPRAHETIVGFLTELSSGPDAASWE